MVYILKMKTLTLGRIYEMKFLKKGIMAHLFIPSLQRLVKSMYRLLPKNHE